MDGRDSLGGLPRWAAAMAAVALAVATGSAGPAAAQSEPVVVVELYTAQGCSSCPPSDDLLATLARDERVAALALHVDYWDYIGWADSFAKAEFTKRQKDYARAAGTRSMFTPQMIVGGIDRVAGTRPAEVDAFIDAHLGLDRPVELELKREGDAVLIDATARAALPSPLMVQMVRYDPEETVSIERGENAGLTVAYHNIVTDWTVLGEWAGSEPLRMKAADVGDGPLVVILQEKGPGLIVAAARLR